MTIQPNTPCATNFNQRRRALMRATAFASVLVLGSFVSTAMAQDNEKRGPGINVPCCQCIDGKETVIDLNTGTAPWTSPSGAVTPATPAGPWASSPPAKWIYTGNNAQGKYTYQLHIQVPKCVIPMSIKIEGKAWADDIVQMQLDSAPLGSSSNAAVAANSLVGGTWPNPGVAAGSYGGFGQTTNLNINQAFSGSASGNHILTATVNNAGGPTGFLFHGKLVVKCSSGPLTQGGRTE